MEDRENTVCAEETAECENAEQESCENAGCQNDKKSQKEDKKKSKKLEAELAEANKKLESGKTELAALNDKYLRMMAEYDNFRRRSQKEKEETYGEAFSEAISAILPIMDNVERAAQYSESESVAKGLEMIAKSFAETLAKLGASEIEALGKTFDPNLHNAVMHIDDEAYGEGEIAEVFQKGYAIGNKVIRHAMVKVAN